VTSTTAKVSKPAVESANPVAWVTALIAAIVASVLILKIPPLARPWPQSYDPTGHWWLSALLAALPDVVLLGTLALLHMKAHYSALLGLATSLLCAIWIFGMPVTLAAKTAVLGAGYGLLPIGWIILNVIFLYQLTCDAGLFKVLQESLTGITQDRRLQLLLIAFSFGAFFEGAAGFGTPVAVTAAVLIGLGFGPLEASGLSLIANTAPVAY
jgi:lactate permease